MTSPQTKKRLSRTRGADHVDKPPKLVPVGQRRRGRPEIELLPAMKDEACRLARTGATMLEVAKGIGVALPSLYKVLGADEDFMNSVKEGREFFDERVISALGQRAAGFHVETEKVFSNGLRTTVTEYVPPDTSAAMFWLFNRKGWRKNDNVVQDAIDAAANAGDPDAPVSTKTLAMAALALLTGAALAPQAQQPTTIDITPNPTPGPDEEIAYDDRDPDFDI